MFWWAISPIKRPCAERTIKIVHYIFIISLVRVAFKFLQIFQWVIQFTPSMSHIFFIMSYSNFHIIGVDFLIADFLYLEFHVWFQVISVYWSWVVWDLGIIFIIFQVLSLCLIIIFIIRLFENWRIILYHYCKPSLFYVHYSRFREWDCYFPYSFR